MIRYLDELEDLELSVGDYVLTGSAVMAVAGLRENKDLDIMVRQDVWDRLKARPDFSLEAGKLARGHLEVMRDSALPTMSADDLIEAAEIIDGHPYVPIKYVAMFKLKRKTQKDLADYQLIEKFYKHP